MLRRAGPTTFRETVRHILAPASSVAIPEVYQLLWRLRPRGVLTLNLDRLATRSYGAEYPGRALIEFSGKSAGSFAHTLKSPLPFVANLHGIVDDESSWVLDHDELRNLLRNPGYIAYVRACLLSATVVFIGVTAEDVAVGGHLEGLRAKGLDLGAHFWITDRGDCAAQEWAERAGVRVIRYAAPKGDHSELGELLSDLQRFVPKDTEAAPVAVASPPSEAGGLPAPATLRGWSAEEIRRALNAHASAIIAPGTPEAYQAYEDFSRRYDEAIYRAWYTSTNAPDNVVLGNTILRRMAKGAFAQVFEAQTRNGSPVAVKVLHHEVRNSKEMLQSFRRGVRSMRILSDRRVEGMVPYREASEIPACVVMDLVDGPNLYEVVRARQLQEWRTVLRVGADLAGIIRRAHALPERVLHRDIRPSNVMIEGFYSTPESWRVVVLDFDLSWHVGALEESVRYDAPGVGYLAPEQVFRDPGVSTRHAAVDSYGLGMTLYFLCSSRDPWFAQHQHAEWRQELQRSVGSHDCPTWVSLPVRVARLIENCTRQRQELRWDMSQIAGELERLRDAESDPSSVASAELLAEELLARGVAKGEWVWDCAALAGHAFLPSGIEVTIKGQESKRSVALEVGWASAGIEERKRIQKWLKPACQRAVSRLEGSGWRSASYSAWGESFSISASVDVASLRPGLADRAAGLKDVLTQLRFE